MRHWRTIPIAILVAACVGEENQSNDPLSDITESQVVESSAPRWSEGEGWMVVDSAVLDLADSGNAPAYEFERVTDALWLDDGRIVVADDGWREVRFFSPSGEFIASVGRAGEGPGEFQRIQTISPWRGDSIVVFDQRLDRATVLSENGGVRTIPLADLSHRPEYLRALGASGLIGLFSSPAFQPAEPGAYRVPYLVIRLDEQGVVLDTLGQIGGREGYWAQGISGPLLIGKDGHLAARGGDAVFGDADSLQYERYREGIGSTQRVRVPTFDLTLSAQEVEDVRQRFLRPQDPPDVRRAVEAMPFPSSRPAFSKLLIDDEGCLWAASYRIPGEPEGPRDWQVFDSVGTWLGRVSVPARFSPLDIGSDFILGVWLDPLDVHHVQIRPLVRTWE
jgi:hypothetical protein